MKALVLGGVRSGKSRIAARLASGSGKSVVVVATARACDEEMRARIEAHRRVRPAHWRVVEEPVHLASVLRDFEGDGTLLLVDCLTLWLTNLLLEEDPSLLETERGELLRCFRQHGGDMVLVSNETNMGVTPAGELSRRFCDEAGALHQELAELCDTVVFAVAGLPQLIKSPPAQRP